MACESPEPTAEEPRMSLRVPEVDAGAPRARPPSAPNERPRPSVTARSRPRPASGTAMELRARAQANAAAAQAPEIPAEEPDSMPLQPEWSVESEETTPRQPRHPHSDWGDGSRHARPSMAESASGDAADEHQETPGSSSDTLPAGWLQAIDELVRQRLGSGSSGLLRAVVDRCIHEREVFSAAESEAERAAAEIVAAVLRVAPLQRPLPSASAPAGTLLADGGNGLSATSSSAAALQPEAITDTWRQRLEALERSMEAIGGNVTSLTGDELPQLRASLSRLEGIVAGPAAPAQTEVRPASPAASAAESEARHLLGALQARVDHAEQMLLTLEPLGPRLSALETSLAQLRPLEDRVMLTEKAIHPLLQMQERVLGNEKAIGALKPLQGNVQRTLELLQPLDQKISAMEGVRAQVAALASAVPRMEARLVEMEEAALLREGNWAAKSELIALEGRLRDALTDVGSELRMECVARAEHERSLAALEEGRLAQDAVVPAVVRAELDTLRCDLLERLAASTREAREAREAWAEEARGLSNDAARLHEASELREERLRRMESELNRSAQLAQAGGASTSASNAAPAGGGSVGGAALSVDAASRLDAFASRLQALEAASELLATREYAYGVAAKLAREMTADCNQQAAIDRLRQDFEEEQERARNLAIRSASVRTELNETMDEIQEAKRLNVELNQQVIVLRGAVDRLDSRLTTHGQEAKAEAERQRQACASVTELTRSLREEFRGHVELRRAEDARLSQHGTQRYLEQIDKALGLTTKIEKVEQEHGALHDAVVKSIRLPRVVQ
eukprot:TRINITY_DN24891_c0_g1_i1.p1 TRINITY_DN24891_c0_g1~~TRINITY_DN24891_c0_g1_i1.p1  ORF type:complete len:799 (+),score=224.79 TRINITY_DN24891_c0_g1_i1:117-2513(+)